MTIFADHLFCFIHWESTTLATSTTGCFLSTECTSIGTTDFVKTYKTWNEILIKFFKNQTNADLLSYRRFAIGWNQSWWVSVAKTYPKEHQKMMKIWWWYRKKNFALYLLVQKVLHSMNGNGFHDLGRRKLMLNRVDDGIQHNWSIFDAKWFLWQVAVQQRIQLHRNEGNLAQLALWSKLCLDCKMVWIGKFGPL